jgi:hypothetical protein
VAGASETEGGVRPSASWQAVTCVNTETAPKDTMRRPTLPGLGEGCHGWDVTGRRVPSASPGWWVTACQQGAAGNTGDPSAVAGYRPRTVLLSSEDVKGSLVVGGRAGDEVQAAVAVEVHQLGTEPGDSAPRGMRNTTTDRFFPVVNRPCSMRLATTDMCEVACRSPPA